MADKLSDVVEIRQEINTPVLRNLQAGRDQMSMGPKNRSMRVLQGREEMYVVVTVHHDGAHTQAIPPVCCLNGEAVKTLDKTACPKEEKLWERARKVVDQIMTKFAWTDACLDSPSEHDHCITLADLNLIEVTLE